jgi:hypothetical protein
MKVVRMYGMKRQTMRLKCKLDVKRFSNYLSIAPPFLVTLKNIPFSNFKWPNVPF